MTEWDGIDLASGGDVETEPSLFAADASRASEECDLALEFATEVESGTDVEVDMDTEVGKP